MLRKRIRFSTAAGILFLVAVSAFAITNQMAEEKTKKPDVVYTEYQCVRCHVNDKTILRMQDKAGNANRWSSFLSDSARAASAKCPANGKQSAGTRENKP